MLLSVVTRIGRHDMASKVTRKPIEEYHELSSHVRAALSDAVHTLQKRGNLTASERLLDAIAMTVSKKSLDSSMIGNIGLAYVRNMDLYPEAGLERHLGKMLADERRANSLVLALKESTATRERVKHEPSTFMDRILMPNKMEALDSTIIIRNDEKFRTALEDIRKAIDSAVCESFSPPVHILSPKAQLRAARV